MTWLFDKNWKNTSSTTDNNLNTDWQVYKNFQAFMEREASRTFFLVLPWRISTHEEEISLFNSKSYFAPLLLSLSGCIYVNSLLGFVLSINLSEENGWSIKSKSKSPLWPSFTVFAQWVLLAVKSLNQLSFPPSPQSRLISAPQTFYEAENAYIIQVSSYFTGTSWWSW